VVLGRLIKKCFDLKISVNTTNIAMFSYAKIQNSFHTIFKALKATQSTKPNYRRSPTGLKGTLRCRLSYGYFSFIAKYASN